MAVRSKPGSSRSTSAKRWPADARLTSRPPPGRSSAGDPVDQHEMAEMVGAELGLEAVGGAAERGGHHPGIGDDDVERPAVGDEGVGAGAHAGQRGEVELDDLEAAAAGIGRLAHRLGRPLRLVEIAGGADDLGAVGDERARRLDAEPGRDAGDEHALAGEVDAGEDLVGGGQGAEGGGGLGGCGAGALIVSSAMFVSLAGAQCAREPST